MVSEMAAEEQLRALYEHFNARDVEAVLAATADDVDWPNGWEGGRLHGHEAVRAYWLRQWSEIDPHVDPLSIATRPDGRIAVDVHQVVRSLDGQIVADGSVVHVYEMRDGLVTRMSIEEASPEPE